MDFDTRKPKQMVAVSHATYRKVTIIETANGCTVVLGGKQYDCEDLAEAKGLIDAAYAAVLAEKEIAQ